MVPDQMKYFKKLSDLQQQNYEDVTKQQIKYLFL
jgi:hypothetical protein